LRWEAGEKNVEDKKEYCGEGCQSRCGGPAGGDLSSIIPRSSFDQMLKHRNDLE